MTDGRGRPLDLEQALIVDEIGIETGIYGKYRLKTAHQPIFRREGSDLVPFAVEARILPHREGKTVAPVEFFEDVPQMDRPFVEALCRTLHLRNHRNVGIDEPERFELHLPIDPRWGGRDEPIAAAASIARIVEETGLSADMITCEILDASVLDSKALVALAGELRGHGVRISIAEFRAGKSAIDRVTQIEPDIIKIDGAWFRGVQESAETAQLFPAVITAFRGFGAKLLVQGIETAVELKAALDAGADHLQGMLLCKPALAGAIFDDQPRSIKALLGHERTVISLGGNHQKR